MGAGRSGSTVLGVALGNCTDHFFVGELEKWFSRSGVSPRKGEQRAGFWARVLEHLDDDPTDLFGREHMALERSSALLDPRAWFIRRRLRERYRRVAEELYVAIGDVAEASHIVDTSHYPLRARELQALDGIELYLVYLVRDPQGVVASLDAADPTSFSMGTLVANAYLWLTHLVSVGVFLRHRGAGSRSHRAANGFGVSGQPRPAGRDDRASGAALRRSATVADHQGASASVGTRVRPLASQGLAAGVIAQAHERLSPRV